MPNFASYDLLYVAPTQPPQPQRGIPIRVMTIGSHIAPVRTRVHVIIVVLFVIRSHPGKLLDQCYGGTPL